MGRSDGIPIGRRAWHLRASAAGHGPARDGAASGWEPGEALKGGAGDEIGEHSARA